MNDLGLKKTIGKMGSLAKTGVEKAGRVVKSEYNHAKAEYPETKRKVGKAVAKADRIANRGLDYAERVRDNASESSLFKETESHHGRHEQSERFFIGADYERAEHRRPRNNKRRHSGQTIVINVNGNSGRKKKRQRSNNQAGFSLL